MPVPRSPGVLRWLGRLLIRGPGAEVIRADLDEAMERDIARGMSPWRARYRYGANVLMSACSAWRARELKPTLGVSWVDVKLAGRILVKHPVLTFVSVFALAIAIPAGLGPMHFTDAVLAPLPVDEGDRIRVLNLVDRATSGRVAPSAADLLLWRAELNSFQTLGATTPSAYYNVAPDGGSPAPARGAEVTASAFDILRTRPLLGRALLPADEVVGAPDVVVIGYDLWRSRLGGAYDVVGRTLSIGRVPHTVVGVMPEGFLFPFRDQLWLPLNMAVSSDEARGNRPYLIFGRLRDGFSQEEAQAELSTVGPSLAAESSPTDSLLSPEVVPFAMGFFGLPPEGVRRMPEFYLVQVLALLVLVVACANIGMLILTRTASRSAELAIRTALGASRTRVVSQLFTESLVLAVLAAGVGLLLGNLMSTRFWWLLDVAPYWVDLGVKPKTALWALCLAVFSAGVVGVVPALKVTGKKLRPYLHRTSVGRSGIRFGGMSSALIVIDVALTVATVSVTVGFTDREAQGGMHLAADQFLSAELRMRGGDLVPDSAAAEAREFAARMGAVQRELTRRLEEEPLVRGVAVGNALPRMDHPLREVEVDGDENVAGGRRRPRVSIARVDPAFFEALEQPILAGRAFTASDLGEQRSAVIVNTAFVDRFLAGRNPIGRRVRYKRSGDSLPGAWYEIVGVVGDLGMDIVTPGEDPGLYHPLAPGEANPVYFALHVVGEPMSFAARLREMVAGLDDEAVVLDPVPLDEVVPLDWRMHAWTRLGAKVLIGILLALSVTGIYALMSFTVTQRTKEIGIRAALGAERISIALTVARRAVAQLGAGVLLGTTAGGWLLAEFQRSGRLPPHSPLVLAIVAGVCVMVLVGTLACIPPTMRALRIAPTEAFRE